MRVAQDIVSWALCQAYARCLFLVCSLLACSRLPGPFMEELTAFLFLQKSKAFYKRGTVSYPSCTPTSWFTFQLLNTRDLTQLKLFNIDPEIRHKLQEQ